MIILYQSGQLFILYLFRISKYCYIYTYLPAVRIFLHLAGIMFYDFYFYLVIYIMFITLPCIKITLELDKDFDWYYPEVWSRFQFSIYLTIFSFSPQYLDVLSGEIEKNLYKICIYLYIYNIQILYSFFSIKIYIHWFFSISPDKTSRYCVQSF